MKYKVGDRVKFHKWDTWANKLCINKEFFENGHSYDKVYTITGFDSNANTITVGVCSYLIHHIDHVYPYILDVFDEELFTI